jgi:lectin, mannose-binding 1
MDRVHVCIPSQPKKMRLTSHRLPHSEWTVDIDFRATGADRGGGSLQIWYTKENQNQIGSSGPNQIGKFEGLLLVVDPFMGPVSDGL